MAVSVSALPSTGWPGVAAHLVESRGDALLRYALLISGSREDAADLVQDALVQTFGRVRNGFTPESAEAYVRRSILNGHIDASRRRARWRSREHLLTTDDRLEAADGSTDTRIGVLARLRLLPPRERACVVLRYFEDLTVKDIAKRLSISEGSVKRYLSDALGRLASERKAQP